MGQRQVRDSSTPKHTKSKWIIFSAPEGTVLDGTCEAIDIMGTREAFSEMQLAYACQIKVIAIV